MHTITFIFTAEGKSPVKREVALIGDWANKSDMLKLKVKAAREWAEAKPSRSVSAFMPGNFKTTPLKALELIGLPKLYKHYNNMRNYVGD